MTIHKKQQKNGDVHGALVTGEIYGDIRNIPITDIPTVPEECTPAILIICKQNFLPVKTKSPKETF